MMEELKVSAIQMVSSDQLKDNLKTANGLINQAVSNGAQLVVLPENFALMPKHAGQLFSISETLGEGDIQSFLSKVANENDCWIVAGSMPIKSTRDDKVYATCLVYNSVGEQVAHYHKIHLFDADISDDKGRYRESDTFLAGDQPVVVNTPFGVMGLSICYDLRFPELYRELMQQGAEFIVAPSAFTETTGQAHWALLCRTRAVENACYLIAANQGGVHNNGRATYGHSMIVDPWGKVLSELSVKEGIATGTLKKSTLINIRTSLPAIQHRRL